MSCICLMSLMTSDSRLLRVGCPGALAGCPCPGAMIGCPGALVGCSGALVGCYARVM